MWSDISSINDLSVYIVKITFIVIAKVRISLEGGRTLLAHCLKQASNRAPTIQN
jgi:hypothetical protein